MGSTAKATGYLELNIAGFDQAIKSAKNLMAGLAASFAAFKVGQFFTDGIKDAITFGKEIQVISNKMGGMDPGKMLIVQKALEQAGLGAEEAQAAISDFIDQGRNISEIFGGSENYAVALKKAAETYGEQAEVVSRSGKSLQAVWNSLESIASKVRAFFLSMTEGFVKPLQVALDYLNELDLAGIGAEFGEKIGKAMEIMVGLFKNGDTYKAIEIGLKIAFQEGVNYLVGGFNYLVNNLGPQLSDAFEYAGGMLRKVFEFLASDGIQSLIAGFASVAYGFLAKLLEGFNTIFRILQAGIQAAVQAGIDSVPGLRELLGMGGQKESFTELMAQTSGPVSDKTIDAVRELSKSFGDDLGATWEKVKDSLGKPGDGNGFSPAKIFDSTDLKQQFGDLLVNAQATARGLESNSAIKNRPPSILNTLTGSGTGKVIADNLAKVGGGGNYLRVGMSLAERSAVRTAKATEQTAQATQALVHQGANRKPQAPVLAR